MKALAEKEGVKPFKYIVVKCEHTVYKNGATGLIRYFRPVDICEEYKERKHGRKD
jgi:hypothetical protein